MGKMIGAATILKVTVPLLIGSLLAGTFWYSQQECSCGFAVFTNHKHELWEESQPGDCFLTWKRIFQFYNTLRPEIQKLYQRQFPVAFTDSDRRELRFYSATEHISEEFLSRFRGVKVGMPRWSPEMQQHWLRYTKWKSVIPVIHGTKKKTGAEGILKETGMHNTPGTSGPGVYCAFFNDQTGDALSGQKHERSPFRTGGLKGTLKYGLDDKLSCISRHVLAVADMQQIHFCRRSQWLVATDRPKFTESQLKKLENTYAHGLALHSDSNGNLIPEAQLSEAVKNEIAMSLKQLEPDEAELWEFIRSNIYRKRCNSIIPLLLLESTAKTLGLRKFQRAAKDETLENSESTPWHRALGVLTLSLGKQVTLEEEKQLPQLWCRFMCT